ncbi:MAG TPA: hypothetical protein VFH43_10440, partial [Candidatus Kapabacteria bacterium]|nr:hypothetical protein [Candidatus Kapabacteria bacterium]
PAVYGGAATVRAKLLWPTVAQYERAQKPSVLEGFYFAPKSLTPDPRLNNRDSRLLQTLRSADKLIALPADLFDVRLSPI